MHEMVIIDYEMLAFFRCSSGVHHIIINHKNGKFDVASGTTFNTLAELVEFYMVNQKLQDISNKTPINLKEVCTEALLIFDVLSNSFDCL